MLLFSSALGQWVDRSSRITALLRTIIVNRIAVLVSCVTWFAILSVHHEKYKRICFILALFLGMIEKLSRATNILSMERDWVPVLANSDLAGTSSVSYNLTHLNTLMRRIDMLCKLVAPLFVSFSMGLVRSEEAMAFVIALFSTLSWGFECWCIQQVWKSNSRARVPKPFQDVHHNSASKYKRPANILEKLERLVSSTIQNIRAFNESFRYYFSTPVWIPSMCAAVPHASVLTFSGTLIIYLLNAGFSLKMVTIAKFVGAIFEIASTFIFPLAVRMFSLAHTMTEEQVITTPALSVDIAPRVEEGEDLLDGAYPKIPVVELGVIRTGRWGLCTLFMSLVSTCRYTGSNSSLPT